MMGSDPAAGPTGRCPVQPSTPLGPDQVNVLLSIKAQIGPAAVVQPVWWAAAESRALRADARMDPNSAKTPNAIHRENDLMHM
jgi:hypothetical protein